MGGSDIEITLRVTPYEAQRLHVLLEETAEDLRWQAELLDGVSKQVGEQIDRT